MAGNYAQLLDIINNPTQHGLPAWDNNAKQIEGGTVQQYLLAIINSLTVGYQFMGVATPSTNPGTPDQNVFYIGGAGTYTNFGNASIAIGKIGILMWNGSWSVSQIGVDNYIFNVNSHNNVSAYYSKADARNAVPSAIRTKGLIITYKHNTDGWHTEQFIGDDISGWTTETNWQPSVYGGGQDTTHGTVTLNIGGQTTILGNADKVIKIVGQGTIADGTTGVTQIGDIYYNTDNAKLYRAINISTPLQSSDFEEVPKYEGALYRYGNALYFWENSWNSLIRINSQYIIVLDGMWPSEDPRFYAMFSGHYAYNTTTKKVAQRMSGNTFRSIDLIGSAIYYNKEDGYLYIQSGDHLIKKQLDAFNELSFNGNNNTLSDGNRFAVIPNRRYRFHIPNNIDMSGVTTTFGTRFHIEAIDNNGTITDMVNVAVGNNLESLYDVVFPANTVEAYVGGRCSVGYTFRVVCEMLNENTLFLSDFIKGRWFVGSTVGEQLEERRDGIYSDSYSLKISVDEGQQYVVTLKGATAGRAWYTLDNTGAVVRMANTSFNGSTQITIEEGEVILLIQTNGLDVARAYQINGDIKTKCESNKQVASNDGYRFLASNLTLTENINKTSYDGFRWGVGCKGKARFGNVVLGASSSTFADMKPITYEDGQIIIENNCMFFIHTTRGSVCGSNIVKMDITTYETELIGNIVYRNNNQYYTRFTTGSLMYDRNLKLWIFTAMLWEGNQHMYSGSAVVDVRYGHHILDVTFIDATQKGYDEDSFLYYDTDENSPYYHKYVLINTGTHVGGYGYMDLRLHTADTWNGHYTMQVELDGSQNSSYTGAFINKVGGVPYVFVGTRLPIQVTPPDMSLDEYWILSYPTLTKLGKVNVNSLTGAWGGWGNVLSIPYANGTKYIFITFDRSATSNADQWTYGTTYIYEAEEINSGFEYPVKSFDGSVIAANPQSINPLNLHFRKVFARKIYFKDWLSFAGIYPNLYVNNTYSNELELENATLIALSESIELNSIGNDEGFAMMGKIQPMAAIRLHLFNVDGMAEFVLANDDFSLYRKFQFEILNSQCQVKMVDKLTESDETVVNVSSFIIKGDGVNLIIGQYKNGCNVYYKNL